MIPYHPTSITTFNASNCTFPMSTIGATIPDFGRYPVANINFKDVQRAIARDGPPTNWLEKALFWIMGIKKEHLQEDSSIPPLTERHIRIEDSLRSSITEIGCSLLQHIIGSPLQKSLSQLENQLAFFDSHHTKIDHCCLLDVGLKEHKLTYTSKNTHIFIHYDFIKESFTIECKFNDLPSSTLLNFRAFSKVLDQKGYLKLSEEPKIDLSRLVLNLITNSEDELNHFLTILIDMEWTAFENWGEYQFNEYDPLIEILPDAPDQKYHSTSEAIHNWSHHWQEDFLKALTEIKTIDNNLLKLEAIRYCTAQYPYEGVCYKEEFVKTAVEIYLNDPSEKACSNAIALITETFRSNLDRDTLLKITTDFLQKSLSKEFYLKEHLFSLFQTCFEKRVATKDLIIIFLDDFINNHTSLSPKIVWKSRRELDLIKDDQEYFEYLDIDTRLREYWHFIAVVLHHVDPSLSTFYRDKFKTLFPSFDENFQKKGFSHL